MILSVSRRTDIPNHYSEWFFNRIEDKHLCVRNPRNRKQISGIDLSPEVIDCIVFWTKNPDKMIDRLDELNKYDYYFQFTVNNYGKEIEPEIPKLEERIKTFKRLSEKIGKDRVIWRYDPILLSKEYTRDNHLKSFENISKNLKGYTDKVVISFVDFYSKTKRNTKNLNLKEISDEEMKNLGKEMYEVANKYGLDVESCAEKIYLDTTIGIKQGACIDKKLIERITKYEINEKTAMDEQRDGCLCLKCVDIGSYNTCSNGCKYCYANFNDEEVQKNKKLYSADSKLLCDKIMCGEKIKERPMISYKNMQKTLFDL